MHTLRDTPQTQTVGKHKKNENHKITPFNPMSFNLENIPSQKGKIAIVTGANSGLEKKLQWISKKRNQSNNGLPKSNESRNSKSRSNS